MRTGRFPWPILLGLVLLVIILLVLVRGKHPSSGEGYLSPADCVRAYREASLAGDVPGYLVTLGEPFRSRVQENTDVNSLAERLTLSMSGVKSWVQVGEPEIEDSTAQVEVEVVREEGTQRVRFHLEQTAGGWLIVSVDEPEEVASPTRFGAPAHGAAEED
jgi:hypothetical protein